MREVATLGLAVTPTGGGGGHLKTRFQEGPRGPLGRPWGGPGGPWGILGGALGFFGDSLGDSWGLPMAFGGPLGGPRGVLGGAQGSPGGPWGLPGRLLGAPEEPLGSSKVPLGMHSGLFEIVKKQLFYCVFTI